MTNQPRGFGKVSFHNARDLSYLDFFLLHSIVNIALYFSCLERFRTELAQSTIVVDLIISYHNIRALLFFFNESHKR